MIIFVGGTAFGVVHLNSTQWVYSIVLGFFLILIGTVIRLIPDELLLRFIPNYIKRPSQGPELLIPDEEEHFRFLKPLADVKEELSFLKRVKGGRLNNLRFAIQQTRDTFLTHSRSGLHTSSNSLPRTPDYKQEDSVGSAVSPVTHKRGRSIRSRSNSALGVTTVMAGIITGSVAGWSPIERTYGDSNSIGVSRLRSDLEARDHAVTYPATAYNDPNVIEDDVPTRQVEEINPALAVGTNPTLPKPLSRTNFY
jgi:Ca2+-transporting ATPase